MVSSLSKSKVLLLGGNGFLGQSFQDYFIDNAISHMVTDIVPKWETKSQYEWTHLDVLDSAWDFRRLKTYVEQHDLVINCIGVLGTAEQNEDPIDAIEANILGAINIFNVIREFDTPLIHFATGHKGSPNSYAITKQAAEEFALMYNYNFNTKIFCVRPYNVYGPHQKNIPIRKLVPHVISNAMRNREIEVFGDGLQTVDLVYSKDLVEAILHQYETDYSQVYECGGTGEVTVLEVVSTIINKMNSSSTIKHLPLRQGEKPHQRQTASSNNINLQDLTSLDVGLEATIDYYKNIKPKHLLYGKD